MEAGHCGLIRGYSPMWCTAVTHIKVLAQDTHRCMNRYPLFKTIKWGLMSKSSSWHWSCGTWTEEIVPAFLRDTLWSDGKYKRMATGLMRQRSSSCSPMLQPHSSPLFTLHLPPPVPPVQRSPPGHTLSKVQQIMDEGVLLYHHLSLMMTSPTVPPLFYSVLSQELPLILHQFVAVSFFNHNSSSVSKCKNKWQHQQSIKTLELRGELHIWWGAETTQRHFADQVHFSLRWCFSNCKPTDTTFENFHTTLSFNGAS